MKKFFVLLIAFVFLGTGPGAFSQEVAGDDKAGKKEEKASSGRNGTKPFEMGEIVVKDRAIVNIEDASTTTEITDEDIKERGDTTLADSLLMVPGVSVFSHGKGITRFKLRGFDQDRLAILIDGIPVLDYDSSFDISQVPVMNVSKIVVNRGVSSALYGANGSLGSLNIISKKPEEMFTEVNAEYGQYNNFMLNVANGSPIGDAYYWVTGSVMHSGGYEVSKKLDKSERRKWFDKLVRYDLYGQTFDDLTLQAKDAYINDTGEWNHTEHTKYQVGGKFGYNITDKIEAGLSADYHHIRQESNTFGTNLFSTYDDETDTWSNPGNAAFTTDGKKSCFQNRVFYWPERYDVTVSPYFKWQLGDLTVKANLFYYKQYTDLEAYATQDYSVAIFPASVLPKGNSDLSHSIWTEESYGVNLFPSYKIADWNKLNSSIMYRTEEHTSEEKGVSEILSPNIWAVHGGDTYKTAFLAADYFTIAVEDEMNFSKKVKVTAGVSYDAQNYTDNEKMNTTTNVCEDSYRAKDDSMIWGTRDSFNPAVSVVWNVIEDLLKFRAAASSKTKFPTMKAYSSILGTDTNPDLTIDPERSYNANAGFEVNPMGKLLGLRTDYFYSRFNDKIESIWDQNANAKAYTNIDGVESQGVEISLLSKIEKVAGIADVSSSLSYTYTHAEQMSDDHDSSVNKGDRVENTPEHMFTADLRFDFVTDTSLNISGQHTRNQIMYAMKSVPGTTAGTAYSTEYFEAVELHNPVMINVKISQKIFENFDLFVMCKNILDDYNADPFNPGAGRMFSFGGGAKF